MRARRWADEMWCERNDFYVTARTATLVSCWVKNEKQTRMLSKKYLIIIKFNRKQQTGKDSYNINEYVKSELKHDCMSDDVQKGI